MPGRARRRSARGATLVEFSITVIVILMLVFFALILGITIYQRGVLQNALMRGGRFASVGKPLPGMVTIEESLESIVHDEIAKAGLGLRLQELTACPVEKTCTRLDVGSPNEILELTGTASANVPVFGKLFTYTERVTIRNEPTLLKGRPLVLSPPAVPTGLPRGWRPWWPRS